jgi:hypothetical protein
MSEEQNCKLCTCNVVQRLQKGVLYFQNRVNPVITTSVYATLVYSVLYSVVIINSSMLTITL